MMDDNAKWSCQPLRWWFPPRVPNIQIYGLTLRVCGRVYCTHRMHVVIIQIVQGKIAHPPLFVPLDAVIISLFFVDSFVHVDLFVAMQVGPCNIYYHM